MVPLLGTILSKDRAQSVRYSAPRMSPADAGRTRAAPVIVTLAMEDGARGRFQALRDAHFPSALNRVPAHLTLFHHLPSDAPDVIDDVLSRACARPAFTLEVRPPRSIGRGVAFDCEGEALHALRRSIAEAFTDELTRQDAQGFRPHVTVQNKVTPDVAKATLAAVADRYEPWSFEALGLIAWDYLGGPWRHRATYPFEGVEVGDVVVPAMPGDAP